VKQARNRPLESRFAAAQTFQFARLEHHVPEALAALLRRELAPEFPIEWALALAALHEALAHPTRTIGTGLHK